MAKEYVKAAALKETGKLTLKTSGKLLQGALAGLNIWFAVYDIITLVKDWKTTHPAVEVIVQTMERLDAMQAQVQCQVSLVLCQTLTL